MPTLENDRLVFRFPALAKRTRFSIEFQRTLRIPDTETTYPLPPGLGRFPLRHAEDFPAGLPSHTISRGGVIMPMWQAEAMWLNFDCHGPATRPDFPVAVKIAAGRINALTGESWRGGLSRDPQDYLVAPDQPWLDGVAVEKGVIRQFVAMPLGEGYSVEEQLTGTAEWGGMQISVTPLKAEVWRAYRAQWERERENSSRYALMEPAVLNSLSVQRSEMGLAPGGRMRQAIAPDPFDLDDWDLTATERVFVSLFHAKDWKAITGEAAPTHPPSAKDYSAAGLPWYDFYGADRAALPGSKRLGDVKSVAKLHMEKTGAELPGSADVVTGTPTRLSPAHSGPRNIRTAAGWDC